MRLGRRALLKGGATGAVGLIGGVGLGRVSFSDSDEDDRRDGSSSAVAFRGARQAGIDTPGQTNAAFASFDVIERRATTARGLLSDWTEVAAELCAGRAVAEDSGEATGLGPARLTVTFGFAASFFDDRCAPRVARPAGLVDLPEFPGDELEQEWNGGDLLVQVCADDPTIVSHALRQLRRIGSGRVELRWMQNGFLPQARGRTPRNLFGQVDGTANPAPGSAALEEAVWVPEGVGPSWMSGGTFMAVRRIRMNLAMWDRMGLDVQESTVGRRRDSGAPLSGGGESGELDLDAVGTDGIALIAADAHVRVAKTAGPAMLRRGYSFDNGVRPGRMTTDDIAVPETLDHSDHDDMEHSRMGAAMDRHDAGLFFVAFVRDPATQFVPVQQALSESDALGHFLSYTSASLWAIPAGAESGAVAAGIYA